VRDTPEAGSHPLELTVHPGATHAIGPQTGHLAVFRGRAAAPFRLRIEHPEGELCFAPGRRGPSETRAGLLVESFERDLPGLPTFSCATCEKSVRTTPSIDRRGPFRVTLTSAARRVFIQVDPAYRVPQVNLDNNTWSRSAGENQPEGSS
jgi:hypothetical protein